VEERPSCSGLRNTPDKQRYRLHESPDKYAERHSCSAVRATPDKHKSRCDEFHEELPDLDGTPGKVKKWTTEKENLLCQLWEDEPHLYDATNPDYRNTFKRRATIKKFARILDLHG
jgi:hypothetical protein